MSNCSLVQVWFVIWVEDIVSTNSNWHLYFKFYFILGKEYFIFDVILSKTNQLIRFEVSQIIKDMFIFAHFLFIPEQ